LGGKSAGTSALDVKNLYLLVHNRLPETTTFAKARPDMSFLDSAIEFLSGKEFAGRVLAAALDGHIADDLPLPRALREWTCKAFDVDLDAKAGRTEAIIAILSEPEIAKRLRESDDLFWSVSTIVRLLKKAVDDPERAQNMAMAARIQELGHGVELRTVTGIVSDGPGDEVRYAISDPWIRFHLQPQLARADLVQLEFLGSLDGRKTTGRLYFNYFAGSFRHEDSVLIPLDEDQVGRVTLINPGDIKDLRWDPTEHMGSGTLSVLSAKAVDIETFWAGARARFDGDSALLEALVHKAKVDPQASIASSLAQTLSCPPTDYIGWLAINEPRGDAGNAFWKKQLAALQTRPLISIIMPTYNTDEALLRATLDSVLGQIYPNWELCIADDASPQSHVRAVIEEYAAKDPRVRYVFRDTNGHISAASNSALELARGDWIAMLDHDDLLRPNALLAMAMRIEAVPDAQLIYSDEDKIDENGRRFQPYFKPDFSPELLLAHNYINHFSVFRTETVRNVGGWRVGFEGSQDYDLNLRLIDAVPDARIEHIPEVLYHWRAISGSTALAENEKSYAVNAGLSALRDHLERIGSGASAEQIPERSFFRVRHVVPQPEPAVSLIMPTRDMAKLVGVAARSILNKSTYRNFELIIVDNDSREPETFKLFEQLKTDPRVKILPYPHPFNYSAINNFAIKQCDGDIVGLVNNDIEVMTPQWIEEMVSWAVQDRIGCVGAKLYYPDMTIQHAGVVIGLGGIANHIHRKSVQDSPGYFGRNLVHHNVSAVTAACLFIRRAIYDEMGGLDEQIAVAFNDVDFCLRVREAGYRNLFTPFAELIHHESVSRGSEDTPEKAARFGKEVTFLDKRWGATLREDPYYSPNFDMMSEDYTLGVAPFRKVAA
jgi:glycosyltransferase involved in cell wall biosynthesis